MYEYTYEHNPIVIVNIDIKTVKISFKIITSREELFVKSQKKISMSVK